MVRFFFIPVGNCFQNVFLPLWVWCLTSHSMLRPNATIKTMIMQNFFKIYLKAHPNWCTKAEKLFTYIYKISCLNFDILALSDLFYSDCSRRWSFMFFPKSFQNLSLNCKSLLFSSFCLSELQMPQVISWQICFDFKLLLKSHYSNIFVIICCW